MKKFSPFVFPLIVVGVIFFLVYRWYVISTESVPELGLTEGVQIENLTDEEIISAMQGSDDHKSVLLESESTAEGSIRYESGEDSVSFSVIASLPDSDDYHVWLKHKGSQDFEKAFELTMVKGGYIGSASVDTQLLPLEVRVSSSEDKSSLEEQTVLKGILEVEASN